jgi:hypothetical protein
MSTMPMWMIEGNILYGIICGYTLYLLSLQNKRPSAELVVTPASTPARPGAAAPQETEASAG